MAPHSSTLAWKIPWTQEPGAAVHGVAQSRTWLSDFTFTFHFHALEKEMATHSTILAWRIPGTAEPGGLLSMGSHRVGHDWATSLYFFTFMHWRRKWQPTPVFLPGESQGWGAWWASVYGVTQSRTRLKPLSSSSSSSVFFCSKLPLDFLFAFKQETSLYLQVFQLESKKNSIETVPQKWIKQEKELFGRTEVWWDIRQNFELWQINRKIKNTYRDL